MTKGEHERREAEKLHARKELYRIVLENPMGEAFLEDLRNTFYVGLWSHMLGSHPQLAYQTAFHDLFEHIRNMLQIESMQEDDPLEVEEEEGYAD